MGGRNYRFCHGCKIDKPLNEWGLNRGSVSGFQYLCNPCRRIYNNNRYAKNIDKFNKISAKAKFLLRLELLKRLGLICIKCGNTNVLHLQIEHKNDNGNIERKEQRDMSKTIIKEYLNGIRDINQLQTMCSNCNIEKQLRRYKHLIGFYREAGFNV